MTAKVLAKIAEAIASAPTSRRSVLALIQQDPQRVLDESFEQLAQRAGSSLPTVMRTCRDLGYPGLREFKLALAQEMAVSGSPLHRPLQLVSAATIGKQGVVFAISHVGGMPSLLEAVDVARSQGATVIALTQQGTALAERADIVLGIHVPEDPVMHVGTEAYLVHLTVIEIVTVLVAQRLGDLAVKRLGGVRDVLSTRGVAMRHYPKLDWETVAAVK